MNRGGHCGRHGGRHRIADLRFARNERPLRHRRITNSSFIRAIRHFRLDGRYCVGRRFAAGEGSRLTWLTAGGILALLARLPWLALLALGPRCLGGGTIRFFASYGRLDIRVDAIII